MTSNQKVPLTPSTTKQNQGTSKRDNSIDSLKFLLICTVVFGHVIMTLGSSKTELAMFNFIYSFHMPLFVFLSGYFTRPGEMTEKSVRGAFHFLSLFILFDLLMWIIIPRDVNYRTILTPQYAMWYLLSMSYWRFLSMFVKKEWLTLRNLAIVTVFSALVGFVPFISEIASFNRTVCFLCFFMAGMMCRGTIFFNKVKKIPVWVAIIPSIVIFIIMFNCHIYNDRLQNVYSNAYSGNFSRFGLRAIGMLMAVFFAILGKRSLFFYLYHVFFIAFLPYISNVIQVHHNFTISVLYTIIIICACSLLSNIRILNLILQINMFNRMVTKVYLLCKKLH